MVDRIDRIGETKTTRRDFLGLAGLLTAGLAVFGSLIGMLRLPKPRVSPEASSVVRVGQLSDFPAGSTSLVNEGKIRIVSTEEGIGALSLVCTHLGCIVKESTNGFDCPCHGSKFSVEGRVTGGPAPRPLRWLRISQSPSGVLLVDQTVEVQPGNFYLA